ncbi:alpha/beta hydrolase family protein [Actinoplanes sp. NPDC049265]|uniref:alpha/beta hydrolase family protein n=1 Tax=Actinoplanes sp. NPDC049265 TaxID=3363902 RepID=UPI003713A786
MPRRTPLILTLVLTLTAGCSPTATPAPNPSAPAAGAPASSASAPTSLATPPGSSRAPAGSSGLATRAAPADDLPIASRELDLQRGQDRPLPTTVWYPTAGPKPFPLIVFSHGLTSEPEAYATILEAWARAGFVVAAPKFPHTKYRAEDYDPLDVINQPADVSEVITRMLAYGREHDGLIDPSRIAAAGHSAGGITTVGLFSGTRDKRLTAGVVLSGRQVLPVPFQGAPAPMLFVHGKLDKTVPYADGKATFDAVRWPKALLTVTEGGHVALTKDFAPVIATTTDFLRYALYGDASARKRLKKDATRGGLATLTDDL